MQSLDLCNRYIDEKIREDIAFAEGKVTEIREAMQKKGIDEISSEPLKITSRYSDATYFRTTGIEPEYADGEFVSFMASSFNSNEDFEKLKAAFENIPSYKAGVKQSLGFVKHERVMSIREAMFAESEMVGVDEAIGKICAAPTVSCPPAIPIAVSGERITQEHIAIFKAYSINRIAVVKAEI